jgi:hypothetical protein
MSNTIARMTPRRPEATIKKARTIKVADALWNAALAEAENRDLVLAEEIRKWLQEFVDGKR